MQQKIELCMINTVFRKNEPNFFILGFGIDVRQEISIGLGKLGKKYIAFCIPNLKLQNRYCHIKHLFGGGAGRLILTKNTTKILFKQLFNTIT